MADKLFKLNDVISVEFQATAGSISATLEVYDETGIKDAKQSVVAMCLVSSII